MNHKNPLASLEAYLQVMLEELERLSWEYDPSAAYIVARYDVVDPYVRAALHCRALTQAEAAIAAATKRFSEGPALSDRELQDLHGLIGLYNGGLPSARIKHVEEFTLVGIPAVKQARDLETVKPNLDPHWNGTGWSWDDEKLDRERVYVGPIHAKDDIHVLLQKNPSVRGHMLMCKGVKDRLQQSMQWHDQLEWLLSLAAEGSIPGLVIGFNSWPRLSTCRAWHVQLALHDASDRPPAVTLPHWRHFKGGDAPEYPVHVIVCETRDANENKRVLDFLSRGQGIGFNLAITE